jgi:lysophospholipase L1-like esterase
VLACYEAAERLLYRRWRAGFDNAGWLGRLTVPSADPGLLWEYRPYGEKDGIATNRWGFRDRDYEVREPRPGVRRIAFAGDSVTLGIGVSPEDTFVRRVEAEAAAAGLRPPLEALNFSVDGYDGLQVQQLIRTRVLDFSPAEVVYVMCLNDFDFEESGGQKHLYFRRPRSFLAMRLGRLARRLLRVDYHRHHFSRTRDAVLPGIAALAGELARRGVALRVAIVPVWLAEAPDFAAYPLADLHAEIAGFLGAHGVAHLDLLPELRGRPGAELFADPWHLTAAGHRLVGLALARWLAHGGSGAPAPPDLEVPPVGWEP